jgi:hypothetical protein
MEQSGPIVTARREFQKFVRHFDISTLVGDDPEYRYLGGWLQSWLVFGNGFEYTGRNHATYLRVALDVADAAMRGEIDWNYAGTWENGWKDGYEREGIVALHDPDAEVSANYADPVDYDVLLFKWEHRREQLTGEGAELKPEFKRLAPEPPVS